MIVAAAHFQGCTADDQASELPVVHATMTSGNIYSEVIVPAGQSAKGGGKGFLPYPANMGMIKGVEGDTLVLLRTMIICDALSVGSTLEIKPIALLELDSAGINVDIIVSVPVDTSLKTMQIDGFVDLLTDYEPVRHILQTWFVNHRGFGAFVLKGWRDEKAAIRRIHQSNN